MSDFHENFKKCLFCWYCVMVQTWSHLYYYIRKLWLILYFQVYMWEYKKIAPPPDFYTWCRSHIFRKYVKLDFFSLKKSAGLEPIFSYLHVYRCGWVELITPNKITWRKVTSSCWIFMKTSGNVSLLDIVLCSKYEVICIVFIAVMGNFVFSGLYGNNIGKSLPTKTPFLHF